MLRSNTLLEHLSIHAKAMEAQCKDVVSFAKNS